MTITSIGGKVSVPHLMPYAAAKFAAVGLSEGLRAELAGTGIRVTTVVPGVMRTSGHLYAGFRGDLEAEYAWLPPYRLTRWTLGGPRPRSSTPLSAAMPR